MFDKDKKCFVLNVLNLILIFILVFVLCSEATMVSQTGNHIPSHKPPLEIGEVTAAEQLASASDPSPKAPVSLYDLLEALKVPVLLGCLSRCM